MKTTIIKIMLEGENLKLAIPKYDIEILNEHRDKSRKKLLMRKREFLKGRLSIINEILNEL